jgi:hypothetical protein
MNVPLIGQKQQIPWGINCGVTPDGNVSLVISQGIMGVQAPLTIAQAKQFVQALQSTIDKIENIQVASMITNGRPVG